MKFGPWISPGFGEANEHGLPRRLLLVGESHYGGRGTPDDLTKQVVSEYIDGRNLRFFTGMLKAILGHDIDCTPKNRASFYNTIAFYNFVQHMPIDRERPSPSAWECGRIVFPSCLDFVKPSHVVVFGFEVWDNLPTEGFSSDDKLERDCVPHLPHPYRNDESHQNRGWIGHYEHVGGACFVVKAKHASIGFSPAEWHPWLRWFLQLGRERES